ncbi:MAG: hypothetical protein GTO63_21445 [Anaerolineae bacterium]|nr:hypothetical protein [Anaerolineae bacterium]NIQ80271.1 hypothetical protein [Anaerolineae bacterium]
MATSHSINVTLLSSIMQIGLNGRRRAIPFMLQGKPGVGKTYGVYAIADAIAEARKIKFPAEVWSGPQIQAEDASGLPVPDLETGTTRLLPMRIGSSVLPAGAGVVAIDEFGSLTNTQEAAFLNFVHGGRLGERTLPEAISRGAMMNPEDIASNGRALSPPAANRFAWIPEWDLSPADWCDYMRGGPGFTSHIKVLPDDWDKHLVWARGLLASYIQRNTSQLLNMPPPHKANEAWPSPRSWENAATLLAAARALGDRETNDLSSAAVEACVGTGAAEAFVGYLVDACLPDPEELLADPKNAHKLFPERFDHQGITCESVVTHALLDRKDKVQRWNAAWEIIGPVFVKRNDVAIHAAKMLAGDMPDGATYPKEAIMIRDVLKQSGLAI